MATKGLALVLAASMVVTPTLALAQEPSPPGVSLLPTSPLPMPKPCLDPEKARSACSLTAHLFEKGIMWERRANTLLIEKRGLEDKLANAEDALSKKQEIPEPVGISLPTWLVVVLPIATAALGAGVTCLATSCLNPR